MRSEDTPLLATITDAVNSLRSQGAAIQVDVRQLVVTINESNAIIYSWDDTNNDWNIVVQ